jgi:hypothetical protein
MNPDVEAIQVGIETPSGSFWMAAGIDLSKMNATL